MIDTLILFWTNKTLLYQGLIVNEFTNFVLFIKGRSILQNKTEKTKNAPILVQVGIFAGILFVSSLISALFPPSFPVPTPVIGLLLLYLLLTFKVIKVEWVDSFGGFLISIISFIFVPSGISMLQSIDIMKSQGFKILLVIFLSTIIMLVTIYYSADLLIKWRVKNKMTDDAITGASDQDPWENPWTEEEVAQHAKEDAEAKLAEEQKTNESEDEE